MPSQPADDGDVVERPSDDGRPVGAADLDEAPLGNDVAPLGQHAQRVLRRVAANGREIAEPPEVQPQDRKVTELVHGAENRAVAAKRDDDVRIVPGRLDKAEPGATSRQRRTMVGDARLVPVDVEADLQRFPP